MIEVWNKVDALAAGARPRRCGQVAARTPRVAADLGADGARGCRRCSTRSRPSSPSRRADETLRLGFDQGRERAWLFDRKLVRAERRPRTATTSTVRWTDRDRSQYQALR